MPRRRARGRCRPRRGRRRCGPRLGGCREAGRPASAPDQRATKSLLVADRERGGRGRRSAAVARVADPGARDVERAQAAGGEPETEVRVLVVGRRVAVVEAAGLQERGARDEHAGRRAEVDGRARTPPPDRRRRARCRTRARCRRAPARPPRTAPSDPSSSSTQGTAAPTPAPSARRQRLEPPRLDQRVGVQEAQPRRRRGAARPGCSRGRSRGWPSLAISRTSGKRGAHPRDRLVARRVVDEHDLVRHRASTRPAPPAPARSTPTRRGRPGRR